MKGGKSSYSSKCLGTKALPGIAKGGTRSDRTNMSGGGRLVPPPTKTAKVK